MDNEVRCSINIESRSAERNLGRVEERLSDVGAHVAQEQEKARKQLDETMKGMSADARKATDDVMTSVSKMTGETSTVLDDLGAKAEEQAKRMSDAFKAGAEGPDSARQRLRELTNEIVGLSLQYSSLSEAERNSASGRELQEKISVLTKQASGLKDAIGDVNDMIKNDASDTHVFDGLLQGLGLVISGMGSAQGVASSLGMAEEDLEAVQTKLQTALAASNFLQQAQNTLQKQSAIMRLVQIVQTQAAAKAQEMENLAKGKGIAATVGLTIAQRAFNLVAKANPYVLLAMALLTVVGAVVGLTVANKKNTEEEERAIKAAREHREEMQKMNEEWSSSVASSAAKQIFSLKQLQDKWKALGDDLKAKQKLVLENKSAFNGLGFSVNSVADAEKVLVENTDAVVKAIMARAEASAYASQAEKMITKRIQEENRKDRQTGDFRSVFSGDQIVYDIGALEKEYGIELESGPRGDFLYYNGTRQKKLTAQGARKLNSAAEQVQAVRKREHQQKLAQMKADEEALMKSMNDSLKYQGQAEKSVGVPLYNPSSSSPTKDSPAVRNEEAVAEKIAELRKRNAQSMIDADKDEMSRRISQMEFDRKEQLEELDKIHKDLLEKNGGMLTPDEEEVFTEARRHVYEKENRELDILLREWLEHAEQAQNEYLQQYGTYEEKRAAITESFQKRIDDAKNDGARKMLEQQLREALSDLDMQRLQESIDLDDVFSDIGQHSTKFLKELRSKLEEALDAKGITEENARLLRDKINEISDEIASKGNLWETLLPGLGLRKQLERALAEALARGDKGRADNLGDQLSQQGGWKDVFAFLGGSPLEIAEGVNSNIQSLGDLVDTMGLGGSEFGESVHRFAEGSEAFSGAVRSLASGDVVGALNGVVKGFQSWGKSIGIGNGSNASEVARVTERNTESNERLTAAVERLKETMDRQNGTSAVSTFQAALADQQQVIAQTMEILKSQMGYHGAHHSNAKKFNLGDDAYSRISSLLGRNVGSLDSLYDLTPEEMDEIRTKLTDVWASILSQGDYDKSEYWERYADLAGTIEELTEQINENLTRTSFQSVRDDFVSTLMDMDSDASDFSSRFAEMMQRSLLNIAIGDTIDKELETWYSSWAERLQQGTLTAAEVSQYKSEYDALVRRGLEQREQIAQITGYDYEGKESQGTTGKFRTMSQETGDELSGRFAAIQIQTTRLSDIVQRQAEDVARIAGTGGATLSLMGEMNDVVWQCSTYLESIARNTGYMPSMDRKLEQIRTAVERL
ncbi:MAG: hypothetical protein IKG99_10560 [Bacteroidaceae bacterium]|nr:hypothetical protein [Bacteroidaceae bacterium]